MILASSTLFSFITQILLLSGFTHEKAPPNSYFLVIGRWMVPALEVQAPKDYKKYSDIDTAIFLQCPGSFEFDLNEDVDSLCIYLEDMRNKKFYPAQSFDYAFTFKKAQGKWKTSNQCCLPEPDVKNFKVPSEGDFLVIKRIRFQDNLRQKQVVLTTNSNIGWYRDKK